VQPRCSPMGPPLKLSDRMKLWYLGFGLLMVGITIPVLYGLYEFVLASVPWYLRFSVILILLGVLILMASAVRDRINQETPEQRV